jgi:hypothetical protein
MNKRVILKLLALEPMIGLIWKKDNLSGPGLDDITFPFLKFEKKLAFGMIIEMILFIFFSQENFQLLENGYINFNP